jgi:hypothetical protein
VGLLDKLLSRQPNRKEFSQIVMRVLNEKGITNIRYDEKSFLLQMGDGNNVAFLENSYVNYCKADRRQRQEFLVKLAAACLPSPGIPAQYSEAEGHLMPIVRDPSYLSLVELQSRARDMDTSKMDCPTGKLADGLVVLLAYDTEASILQVNRESFDRWGISFDEALKAARNNLREKTNSSLFDEVAPGVYRGRWADSYDSSRLLLTDLIYRLPLEGEPVAFIPNRDQLWVTGRLNRNGLKTMIEQGQPAHFSPYAVSPNLYVLNDGVWSTYIPEDSHVRDAWIGIRRKREALDYQQQKESLDTVHGKAKIDIFVANYLVFKREGGSEYSTCAWSRGVDSLLPQTDTISFVTDPANTVHFAVSWQAAVPIVASLMEKHPSLVPVRYRVRSFPTQAQLEELRRVGRDGRARAEAQFPPAIFCGAEARRSIEARFPGLKAGAPTTEEAWKNRR